MFLKMMEYLSRPQYCPWYSGSIRVQTRVISTRPHPDQLQIALFYWVFPDTIWCVLSSGHWKSFNLNCHGNKKEMAHQNAIKLSGVGIHIMDDIHTWGTWCILTKLHHRFIMLVTSYLPSHTRYRIQIRLITIWATLILRPHNPCLDLIS